MRFLIAFIGVISLSSLNGVAWGVILPGPAGMIPAFLTAGIIGFVGVNWAINGE